MPLDFPSSPIVDQTYSVGSRTWKYNGVAWEQISTTFGPTGPTGPMGPTGPAGSGGGGGGELANLNWYVQGTDLEGVAYDSEGYSYSLFNFNAASPNEPITVVKTSPDGSIIFAKHYGPSSGYGQNIFVDNNKNIYLGIYDTNKYVLKLDSNGDIVWQKSLESNFTDIHAVQADSLGNVYAIGPKSLIKFNSSGVEQFTKGLDLVSYFIYDIEIDPLDNVLICGTNSSVNPNAGFIIKYNSAGVIQWQKSITETTNIELMGVTSDQFGNIYVCGNFWSSPSKVVVLKYNSAGVLQWQKILSQSSSWLETLKLTCDEYSNVYILAAKGGFVCLYKISSSGSIIWQKTISNGYPSGWYCQSIDVSDESILFSVKFDNDDTKCCSIQLYKAGNFNSEYGLFNIQDGTSTIDNLTATSSDSSLSETTPSVTVSVPALSGPILSTFEQNIYRIFSPGASVAAPEYVTLGPGLNTQNLAVNVVPGSLANLSSGLLDLAIGANALKSVTTGYWNTAIGYDSMKNLTTGTYNTALGPFSLNNLTTGGYNVAIGNSTLSANVTGSYNVAIGSFALNTAKGSSNFGIGYSAFQNAQLGGNIGIGMYAGYSTVSSNNNLAIGHSALNNQSDAIVSYTLVGGSGYTDGTYTGLFLGAPNTGALGSLIYDATVVISGGSVTSVTYSNSNVYRVIYGAIFEFYSGQIPGGGSGFQYIITGTNFGSTNFAIGHNSLYSLTTSSYNTAIGTSTGYFITTGNNNVLVGYSAGFDLTTGSNNIVIGTEASASSSTVSNEITLGKNTAKSFRIPGLNVEWKDGQGTLSINSQSSSNYSLILTDSGKLVEMNSTSPNTITVPLDSFVNCAIGTQINILQAGTGQTTIQGESGVTVNGTPGLNLRAQWSYATIIKRGANNWVVIGDVSA